MHSTKQILVVDDEKSIRSFLAIILQSEGYVVHKAATASQALDILQAHPVDLVTLDLGLPDMDGLELLEIIKKNNPALPVIILSVRNDTTTRKEAVRLGASHYIAKPFEGYEVIESVHEIFS